MSKFFVVANLKMNKSFNESVIYLESLIQNVTNYDDEIIVQEIGLNIMQDNEKIIKFNSLDSLIEALTEIKKGL